MAVKLIGSDNAGSSNWGTGYVTFSKYTASASGNCTVIKVYSLVNGNVRVAIYSHNAGTDKPDALLNESASVAVTAGDWRSVTIPDTPITNGTIYWLAVQNDTSGAVSCVTPSAFSVNYIAQAYGAFPANGSGSLTLTNYEVPLQGWEITLTISPSSISQPVNYGTPALLYPQILLPSSIVQAIVYGTPSVFIAGMSGYIYPQSIVQQISIGSPTLLKYVWHVILDGQYITESPDINRAYVIGRDAYGNPVYGEAHDSAESSLVGERLDFIPDPAIPTTAQAGDVASAVLSKMRLTGKRGVILIPPNCGQELFDVVQVSDSMANQSAVTFRVVGVRFEYNPKQARYQHKLILGAP